MLIASRTSRPGIDRISLVVRSIALVCLLLTVFTAAAQAVHFHAKAFSDHESCVVCQVAHAPGAPESASFVPAPLGLADFLTRSEFPAAEFWLHALSLFCRPPPGA